MTPEEQQRVMELRAVKHRLVNDEVDELFAILGRWAEDCAGHLRIMARLTRQLAEEHTCQHGTTCSREKR